MSVVPAGGLHSPPRRSKIEASEGQRNRIAREAMQFLHTIENDLNPQEFTFEEIVEEGLGAMFGITGEFIDAKYRAHVSKYLNFLIERGYVEVLDEDAKTYCLMADKLAPPIPLEGMR